MTSLPSSPPHIMKVAFAENLGLGEQAPTSWLQGCSYYLHTIGGTPCQGNARMGHLPESLLPSIGAF